jgi:hypothetical protein
MGNNLSNSLSNNLDIAKKSDLSNYVHNDVLSSYATKNDLATYVTNDVLSSYATKNDLATYVTNDVLSSYATKTDIANENYAKLDNDGILNVNGLTVKGAPFIGQRGPIGPQGISGPIGPVGPKGDPGVSTDYSKTFDFVLGSSDQTSRGNTGNSRALVKDSGGKLVLNFANDFKGGIDVGASGGFRVGGIINANGYTLNGAPFTGGPKGDKGDPGVSTDYSKTFDFILGSSDQTSRGDTGNSRALVKDSGGKLVLNFANDFKGGIDVGASGGFRVGGIINASGYTLNGAPFVGERGPPGPPGPKGEKGDPGSGFGFGSGSDYSKTFDFVLGSSDQTSRGDTGNSRALVKDSGGKLVLNFANDFKGGIDVGASGGFRVGGIINASGYTLNGAPFVGERGPPGPKGEKGDPGVSSGGGSGTDYSKTFDFVLGSSDQTSRGNTGNSRALVKDSGGRLIMNFSNDFKGGIDVGASGGFRVGGDISANSYSLNNSSKIIDDGQLRLQTDDNIYFQTRNNNKWIQMDSNGDLILGPNQRICNSNKSTCLDISNISTKSSTSTSTSTPTTTTTKAPSAWKSYCSTYCSKYDSPDYANCNSYCNVSNCWDCNYTGPFK